MGLNARYQFVLLYTVGWDRIAAACADINRAIEDGALQVGERAGLPLRRFALENTAGAHCGRERSDREGAHRGRSEVTMARGRLPARGTLLLPARLRAPGRRITRPLEWTTTGRLSWRVHRACSCS
jgi:hypothetical protein